MCALGEWMRAVGLVLGMTACGSPLIPPCTPWLEVRLTVPVWRSGAWQVQIEPPGLSCTITVPPGDVPPVLADLSCDGRVERAGVAVDTAGGQDPLAWTLRVALTETPEQVTVRTSWSDGEGATWSADHQLDPGWRVVPTPGSWYRKDCEAGRVDVALPDVAIR